MTHQYSVNNIIESNNDFYKILKLITIDSNLAYQTRKLDNLQFSEILESDITGIPDNNRIITSLWDNFTYNGDNGKASQYVRQKIIGNFTKLSSVSFGPKDQDNYRLKIGDQEWIKEKSS